MLDKLKQYQAYGLPAALIISGALILIAQIINFDWLGVAWPFFIILPGLGMLHIAVQTKSQQYARLIFPAIVVILTGAILLYQTITNHWRSWTFLWALYVVFFGVGLQIYGKRSENPNDVKMGRNLILGGLASFFFLWMLFELVIFSVAFSTIIGYVLPAVFIGAGLTMLGNKYRVYRIETQQKLQISHQNATKQGNSAYTSTEIVKKSDGEGDFSRFTKPTPDAPVDEVVVDIPEIIKPIVVDENITSEIDPDLQRKIDAALNEDAETQSDNQ